MILELCVKSHCFKSYSTVIFVAHQNIYEISIYINRKFFQNNEIRKEKNNLWYI